MDGTLVAVIALALFFSFTNGFHDTANAIATSVSTRALAPRWAVLLASVLNFVGALVSIKVAATVATGIIDPSAVTLNVLMAGIVGAIVWNLTSWYLGLPTSSSHALIGGVAGSVLAASGLDAIQWHGMVKKVLIPGLVSPLAGLVVAVAILVAVFWAFRGVAPGVVNRIFRRLQFISAGFVAFTHGTNDAQKTMGVMALALIAANPGRSFSVPLWVKVSAALVMAAGTYVGGWRIIHTLGRRIVKLEPAQGFAAELSTAGVLYVTGTVGFPVSTTHTISGSVMGAGATTRFSAVRWGIAGDIVVAWIVTVPCAAVVAAALERLTSVSGGTPLVVAIAVATAILTIGSRLPGLPARSSTPTPAAD